MALTFIDNIESSNPDKFAVITANQIGGHRSVVSTTDLTSIPDAILSASKGQNNGADAIGQVWYVQSGPAYYRLINWSLRHQLSGWEEQPNYSIEESKKLRNAGLYGRMNNLGSAYGVRELFKLTTTSTNAEIRSAIKPTDVDPELTKDILDYCVENGSMLYDAGTTHHIVVHKTIASTTTPTWDLIQIDSGSHTEGSGVDATVKVGVPHVKVLTLQFNTSSSTWKVLRVLDEETALKINTLAKVRHAIYTGDKVVGSEDGISIFYQEGETPVYLYGPITSCIFDGNVSIKNATINGATIGNNVNIPDNFTTNVSIKRLTQEQYDDLKTKDSNTLYIIV